VVSLARNARTGDTPLGFHSGLHLDKLDAALDHRNLPESYNCQVTCGNINMENL
jgi:hypothetical protein